MEQAGVESLMPRKRLDVILVLVSSAGDLAKVLDGVGNWTAGE